MKEETETKKRKTPEEYEQSYLPTLEEQDKRCTSEVQNFCNKGHISTHEEIMYMIGRLDEYKKYFLSFQSLAKYLDDAGRPRMLKRLNEILKDTDGTIQIYRQMDQNILNYNNKIFEIQKGMQQYGFDIMKKVSEYRRQEF